MLKTKKADVDEDPERTSATSAYRVTHLPHDYGLRTTMSSESIIYLGYLDSPKTLLYHTNCLPEDKEASLDHQCSVNAKNKSMGSR